jgi:hypothetical protein
MNPSFSRADPRALLAALYLTQSPQGREPAAAVPAALAVFHARAHYVVLINARMKG